MKKSIAAVAFIMLGTMFATAQTTKKDSSAKMSQTPATSTEMKVKTPAETDGSNNRMDTSAPSDRATQSSPNTIQPNQNQNQTVPNTGTLQSPNTTMPNNSSATQPMQPLNTADPKPAQ